MIFRMLAHFLPLSIIAPLPRCVFLIPRERRRAAGKFQRRPILEILKSLSDAEMLMRSALSAPLRLTSGNSLVPYWNILPERYSITVPFREVVEEQKLELNYDNLAGSEALCYDARGHLQREVRKGLLLNAYF
jgi:hypothetical protein